MAYAIMMLKKVKTKAQLRQMYAHQYRTDSPDNADPSLKEKNDIAYPVKSSDFLHAFNERINSLPYYDTHDFRKNGVMAYDIVFEYSADAAGKIDIEKWKQDNITWLKQEFGEENVVSCVYHYDEASYTEQGVVHGHAVVIPVDDKGKVNASYYTGNKDKFAALQDSYAEIMKAHNLERGLRHSAAIHTDIKRFYAQLTNAIYGVPMPERGEHESDMEYIEKMKDAWRTERAAHLK